MAKKKTDETNNFAAAVSVAAKLIEDAYKSAGDSLENRKVTVSTESKEITLAKDADGIFMTIKDIVPDSKEEDPNE